MLAAALLVAVIVEMFNRRSVWRFFVFVTSHPLMFALDFLLIANTMAVSQLFRRRLAVISLVSVFWLAMAITNYVVICFRTQPFTLADVMLVKDMFSLITVYFRWWQIVLIALGILGAVGLIVLMFWKAPRRERVHYGAAVVLLAVMTAMSWGFVRAGQKFRLHYRTVHHHQGRLPEIRLCLYLPGYLRRSGHFPAGGIFL